MKYKLLFGENLTAMYGPVLIVEKNDKNNIRSAMDDSNIIVINTVLLIQDLSLIQYVCSYSNINICNTCLYVCYTCLKCALYCYFGS